MQIWTRRFPDVVSRLRPDAEPRSGNPRCRGGDIKFMAAAALLFVFSAPLSFTQETASTTLLPEKSRFHLYLLIGQSNMEGRGALDQEGKVADPRVLMLDKNNQWVPATDPLQSDEAARIGTGPGVSFGKALATRKPSTTIGLIPCAVGGTPLSRWVKGGPLYQNAVARTREAMKYGELKGIIWHQGESDSKKEELASTYAQRLTGMIADLRTEFGRPGLPFVAGELGDFLLESNLPCWKKVNEAIRSVSQTVPHCGLAVSKGLVDKGDHLHFDTASQRELGRRYAGEIDRLEKAP